MYRVYIHIKHPFIKFQWIGEEFKIDLRLNSHIMHFQLEPSNKLNLLYTIIFVFLDNFYRKYTLMRPCILLSRYKTQISIISLLGILCQSVHMSWTLKYLKQPKITWQNIEVVYSSIEDMISWQQWI